MFHPIYRDLQKRFRTLSQGNISVEEHYEEFEAPEEPLGA